MGNRSLSLLTAGVLFAAFGVTAEPAWSESWPERTVRIVTPFNPGISVDVAARTLADALAKQWKQPVVVENRPGADTMIGTQAFLDMRDNHALLFTTHSTFTVIPLLRAKVPYDPADVKPISLAVEDFLSVVASPKLEIGSLSQFVEMARENPTKLNFYAVPGAPYLAYLAFQKRAGFATTFVAYNSPVSAISDLSEGRIHVAVMPLASVLGAVQAGKVKLLAVTNATRSPAVQDVPTVVEAGYPDFAFGGFLGCAKSEHTRAHPHIHPTSSEIIPPLLVFWHTLNSSDKLTVWKVTRRVTRGTSPAEFATLMDAQRVKWSAIAREHNIEPQ